MEDGLRTRRRFLRTVGVMGVVGVAGCSGSDDSGQSPDPQPTPTQNPPTTARRTTGERSSSETPTLTQPTSPSTASETPPETTSTTTPFTPSLSAVSGQHPHIGVDPQFSNHYSITGPEATLGEAWSVSVQNPGSPILFRDSTYYLLDIGADPFQLLALDAATGREQWSIPLSDSLSQLLAVTDSVLVDKGGTVRDRADGSVQWEKDLRPMLVTDDAIYATLEEDNTSYLARVDPESGSEQWRTQDYGGGRGLTMSPAGIHYRTDDAFGTIDPATGETTALSDMGGPRFSPLGINNNKFIAVDTSRRESHVRGIDVTTGEITWEQSVGGDDAVVRYFAGRNTNLNTAGGPYTMTSTDVIIAGRRITGGDDSAQFSLVLRAHSLEDGSLRWSQELPVGIGGSPQAVDDILGSMNVFSGSERIYAGVALDKNGGQLRTFALNRSDGVLQWSHDGFLTTLAEKAMLVMTIQDQTVELAVKANPP